MTARTPDGRPLSDGMCTCGAHCSLSPYHEPRCLAETWCVCHCHAARYETWRRAHAQTLERWP